ncbi:hypothetical protein B296_00047408 [Ensete ventricosum]|uniref:Uncharacterized protein n=1 Tax=Ensete ventricosum TaxID=4639 RepID=A0A426XEH7_ENSVE|nr:hypothetical protein B296_00047408 [Ensete ventricosum]
MLQCRFPFAFLRFIIFFIGREEFGRKSLVYEDLQQPNRTVSSVTSADRPVLHATAPPSASLLGIQMCCVPSTARTPSLK